jgi:hypothetical protein
MNRRAGVLVVASTVLVSVIACTNVSPDEKIVKDFFRAARLRDNATLGTFATASFEPRSEGSVQSLKVVSITEERLTPLDIKKFDSAFDEAKAAEQSFSKDKNDYQRKNIEAIQRVIDVENGKGKLSRKDEPVQSEWSKYREEAIKHSKAVSDARVQLGNVKGIAELSLSIPNGPTPDVTHMTGQLVSKDVTVDAKVRTPDGQTVDKQLVVTLERCVMKEEQGQEKTGRWIVTRVKDVASGKTS